MIDLHCHILPGIDDGAVDPEDSIGMARQATADGVEAICATPHIRHDHDVRIDEIEARVADLNSRLRDAGLPVAVLAGGEVAETAVDGLDEEELRRVALGDGAWILLEPAPGPLTDSIERRVADLSRRGHRCLIAHPERHPSEDLPERLARLVAAGALVQATAAEFVHEAGAPRMLELAGRGLVHVLGSDAHSSMFGRPVELAAAVRALRAVDLLAPHREWISVTAPRAIVAGDDVEVPFPSG